MSELELEPSERKEDSSICDAYTSIILVHWAKYISISSVASVRVVHLHAAEFELVLHRCNGWALILAYHDI